MPKRQPNATEPGASEPASTDPRDVMFVYGQDDAGDYGVIRQREDQLEVGCLRPTKEGQPIHGELVSLRQRPEHAQLFDVDVVHDARSAPPRSAPPRSAPSRSGPAQVATPAYRSNWERVFGARPRGVGGLEN
ncbi:MAG: hypothetical protein FJ096_04895 [Deltaproteobacteria bacterium]|nr:hypothetical protein [Deltaproteobacteria bacterium]